MTALPRLSFILPSSGLLTMACTHLMIEVTALPTTSSCDGPPSAGCAKGLWNEKECRCNCIPPFCTDFNGVCSADAASCGGSTVVSWEKCVPGIDCPWWASILGEESCTTGSEIPPGIWDIYNSQEECCNTKFSHSSTCKDVRILPRQLQDDIVECTTDQDCYPRIRSRKPTLIPFTKVDMCECYADSNIVPFDECEGEGDDTCPISKCAGDACEESSAVCDTNAGVCDLNVSLSTTNSTEADRNVTVAETASTFVTEPTKPAEVQCTQDAECIPIIRKSVPSSNTQLVGVELCSCYVQSSLEPLFDECQGEDETTCQMTENSIIACDVMACDEKEGYCNTEGGGGVCELRELDVGDEEEGDGGVNATAIATACNTSDDCFPTMRDRVPSNQDVIGVGSCGCYSDSKIDPFDECQGEEDATCATASCVEDSCMMKEAVCDGDLGVCVLEETVPDISGIVAGDDDTNFTATSTAATAVNATETASFETNSDTMTTDPTKPAMVQCTQDSECIPTIRKSIPSPSTPLVGVELCTCYVQSSLEPLFDECQGEDETTCQMTENSIITCDVMACDGLEGYCNVESGNGICELLELGIPDDEVDSSVNATVIATVCNTSNDCFPTMRDRVPSNQDVIGVGSCGCYSDSKIDPFDECQGEEDATCATASCVEDSCMTKKAVCDDDLGVCVLEETVPEISEIVAGDDEGTTLTSSTLTAGTEAVTETSSTAGTTYSTNQPGVSEIGDDIKESDEGEVEGVGSTVTSTTSKSTVSAASVSTTTSTESPISEVGDEAADGDVMDMSPFTDISSSTMVMLGSASTMIVSGNIFLLAGFAAYVVVGFVTL